MQIINSPKIKYFFFDLDGTIFNSIEDIADCCNMALEKFRLPTHGTSKYLDFIGNGERLLIERAIGESRLDNEIFALVRNEYDRLYHENYRRKSRPFDGVCEMLGKIKSNGGVIAILSNKPNEFVEEINKTVFGGVFDVAVGQRKGNKTKPDKTALCDIMKSFGAKKCQCVFVGDSYVDVLTAKNADILSVAVSYGFGKQEEILKYCPDYVCHSVEELSHLLIELQNK